MKMRTYREGDWFAVPLGGGGYAVGLVARTTPRGKTLLGYFYGPRRPAIPTLDDVREYRPDDAILITKFSSLGLDEGTWSVLGKVENWQREMWPIPIFGRNLRETEGRDLAYQVEYSDDDLSIPIRETRISIEESQHLPADGWAGPGWVEKRLTRLLSDKYDPTPLILAEEDTPLVIDHFLYFPAQVAAIRAAKRLTAEGYTVEVHEPHDPADQWLAQATHALPPTAEDLLVQETLMEEVAAAEGGTYDGFERDVLS